jgi:hypothetical protein
MVPQAALRVLDLQLSLQLAAVVAVTLCMQVALADQAVVLVDLQQHLAHRTLSDLELQDKVQTAAAVVMETARAHRRSGAVVAAVVRMRRVVQEHQTVQPVLAVQENR